MPVRTFSDSILKTRDDDNKSGFVPLTGGDIYRAFQMETHLKRGMGRGYSFQHYQGYFHYFQNLHPEKTGGSQELLVLLFNVQIAFIWGEHLQKVVRAITTEKPFVLTEDNEAKRNEKIAANEQATSSIEVQPIIDKIYGLPDPRDLVAAIFQQSEGAEDHRDVIAEITQTIGGR